MWKGIYRLWAPVASTGHPLRRPGPDAAVDDVQDLPGAVADEQAGGHPAALAGAADDGDRAGRIEALRDRADVVVGRRDRSGDVPSVPFGPLAHVEHLERRVVLRPLAQRRDVDPAHAPRAAALLPPARHAALQVAAHRRDPDRAGEVRGADAVLRVAAHEHDLLPALGDPRQLRAEPRLDRRVRHRLRDVRLVELERGADVHHERARALLHLELARSQGVRVDPLSRQRPAVDVDDRLEVRRLGRERARRPLDEAVLVLLLQQLVVAALEPDRGGDLHVHPGAPAQGAAEMPGPHLDAVGEAEQLLVQGAKDVACPLVPVDGEVGPRDVAHEQGVAGQHGPRLRAARGVDQRERRVLGPVPGSVQRAHAHGSQRQLPAVVEGLVVVARLCFAVHVDRGAGRVGEPPVAGDVVGVVVRLEDVLDRHAHVARQVQVLVDVELRVHDRRQAGVLVPDQI